MRISQKGEYYGDKRLETDYKGVLLSEYSYTQRSTDWHCHENPYLMYLFEGNLSDFSRRGKRQIAPGQFMFLNWQEGHRNEKTDAQARGFHIEIDREWMSSYIQGVNLWEGSKLFEDPRVYHTLGKIYAEFRNNDPYAELSVNLLSIQLCEQIGAEFDKAGSVVPDWITDLKEMVIEDVLPLDLSSLSASLGVHPVHISRAVPKYLDMTLGEFIREQRLRRAVSYMYSETHSLTEIAYASGFSDQSHLCRTFKARFGIRPKQFRQKVRNRG